MSRLFSLRPRQLVFLLQGDKSLAQYLLGGRQGDKGAFVLGANQSFEMWNFGNGQHTKQHRVRLVRIHPRTRQGSRPAIHFAQDAICDSLGAIGDDERQQLLPPPAGTKPCLQIAEVARRARLPFCKPG